jgi:hypothetical protein
MMKKIITIMIVFFTITKSFAAYDKVSFRNFTQKTVTVRVNYAGPGWAFGSCFSCCSDVFTVAPGATGSPSAGRGVCLITEVKVDGAQLNYSSSGTSYSKFGLIFWRGKTAVHRLDDNGNPQDVTYDKFDKSSTTTINRIKDELASSLALLQAFSKPGATWPSIFSDLNAGKFNVYQDMKIFASYDGSWAVVWKGDGSLVRTLNNVTVETYSKPNLNAVKLEYNPKEKSFKILDNKNISLWDFFPTGNGYNSLPTSTANDVILKFTDNGVLQYRRYKDLVGMSYDTYGDAKTTTSDIAPIIIYNAQTNNVKGIINFVGSCASIPFTIEGNREFVVPFPQGCKIKNITTNSWGWRPNVLIGPKEWIPGGTMDGPTEGTSNAKYTLQWFPNENPKLKIFQGSK